MYEVYEMAKNVVFVECIEYLFKGLRGLLATISRRS